MTTPSPARDLIRLVSEQVAQQRAFQAVALDLSYDGIRARTLADIVLADRTDDVVAKVAALDALETVITAQVVNATLAVLSQIGVLPKTGLDG